VTNNLLPVVKNLALVLTLLSKVKPGYFGIIFKQGNFDIGVRNTRIHWAFANQVKSLKAKVRYQQKALDAGNKINVRIELKIISRFESYDSD